MTKGGRDSLNRYTVTTDLRFNDLTIRRFNVAKSFDIRISLVRQVPMLDMPFRVN